MALASNDFLLWFQKYLHDLKKFFFPELVCFSTTLESEKKIGLAKQNLENFANLCFDLGLVGSYSYYNILFHTKNVKILDFQNPQNWFHVKSEWQNENSSFSTLCQNHPYGKFLNFQTPALKNHWYKLLLFTIF